MLTIDDLEMSWLMPTDVSQVKNILGEEWDSPEIRELIGKQDCTGYVFRPRGCEELPHTGHVVAVVIVRMHYSHHEIMQFGVHEMVQRCGVGRVVMDWCKSRTARHHRSSLTMWVDDDNLDGHMFLQSQGFRSVSVDGNRYKFRHQMHDVVVQDVCEGRR